uniref:Serum response factor homolog n=1 Tax=Syphacia muris TaxID=451379 RepID=A0A158R5X3_9BILA
MEGECEESSRPQVQHHQIHDTTSTFPNGKKTKGRVKIKMEYIGNKLRRYTTFSKRKTGIMKKAYELSTLTGTQVMLLVASETGHVYTFATKKLQPMISSEAGKSLIQNCLNSPDIDDSADQIGTRNEFTFEPQQSNGRKRKLDEDTVSVEQLACNRIFKQCCLIAQFQCVDLPTMVHPAMVGLNNEDIENSDVESDSADSPEAAEESESDEKQKEKDKVTSLSLQQTLKEALRVAAAQRQLQKNKNRNVQMATNLSLLTPFLMPGVSTPSTSSSTNNSVVYQGPQGVVYANGEGSDNSGVFMNNSDSTAANVNQQFLFPLNSLTLQQNILQMMSSAAISAQLSNVDQSS